MTTGMMMTRDPPPLVFEALSGHARRSLDSQSQHFPVPHGATRSGLSALAWQLSFATPQASTGNVPVILLSLSHLRRRGAVARPPRA